MSRVFITSKIQWHLERLRRMSIREVPYRLKQALLKRIDKYFPPYSPRLLKETTDSIWEQFDDGLEWLKEIPELLPLDMELLIGEAEDIIRHEFEVFGIKANFGNPINFYLDPKTGRTWPIKFWGDINHRDGQTIGGIKFAWELNRLHHWPKLAIAYSLTGDKRYLIEIFDQLKHWIMTNPYPKGINWISGIELGIRIVNLFYSLKLIGRKHLKQLNPEQKNNILKFVSLHGHHLYRYPSKYSSCANHALAEALGLFIAGLAFPCLKEAIKWKSYGKRVLEREVLRQIYPDGSSFEHTTAYLQFVADHFLVYYLICKEYREPIDQNVSERLKTVCNFISSIIDIKGNIPLIGDEDDGYLLRLWFGKHNNFLSLLNTGAILFNRPEWVHPAAFFDFKTLLLLGSSAKPKWEELRSQKAWCRRPIYFNNAGLAVISHSKSGKEILFIGNSGALGLKPLGGHGHADALSFWLSVGGQPFFIDPGTYLYHSGGKWRRFFRSTAAHNTIEIDSKDQAEQISDFIFEDFYKIQHVQWIEKDDTIFWGAEHDGYCRLSDPVIHRREVIYLKKHYLFRICDILKCRKKHEVAMFFHLHPMVSVKKQGDNTYLLSSDSATLVLIVDKRLQPQVFYGSESPLMGWYSPGFNRLEKTNTLVFRGNINSDVHFQTEVRIL